MPFDREITLKKAEKLLRQGRLEAAIAEYLRVVEDQPRDWNTTNALGDLYARAGQIDEAVAQYARIADHFFAEGFYPKAAALYKKILKFSRDHEATQLQLVETSIRQGLIADAKSYLNAVAAKRRMRSDRRGEAEIVLRLGSLDPADIDARLAAARLLEQIGEHDEAAAKYKALYDDLLEKGRASEALEALGHFARLNPSDVDARAAIAKAALESGDLAKARDLLNRETAGNDPALLMALAEIEMRGREIAPAREALGAALNADPGRRSQVVELAWSLTATDPDASFACIDVAVDAAVAASDFDEAASTLEEFVARVPRQIPALLKLVEVCVDGGLEAAMYEAQEQLTDAYLDAGHAAEARVIAEDLVAREPWQQVHIERFRRALVMLRVPEPDSVIAERLSGQSPFTATDPFVDLSEGPPREPLRAPERMSAAGADVAAAPGTVGAPAATAAEMQAPAPDPATAGLVSPSNAGTDEIDPTAALGTLGAAGDTLPQPRRDPPEAAPDALDGVFHQMREEAQVERDYSAQHLTLGRTFLDMGLTDEAISALKTAVRSPRHRFESASLLGRLYRQRGEANETIEWLERAAEAPAPSPDEGRALLYDLGVALEDAGEVARALAVFMELQSDAGDYRDVPSRIDRLARVQTGG